MKVVIREALSYFLLQQRNWKFGWVLMNIETSDPWFSWVTLISVWCDHWPCLLNNCWFRLSKGCRKSVSLACKSSFHTQTLNFAGRYLLHSLFKFNQHNFRRGGWSINFALNESIKVLVELQNSATGHLEQCEVVIIKHCMLLLHSHFLSAEK